MSLKRKMTVVFPAIALLTAGCMVGPDYTNPGAYLSDDYTQIESEGVVKQPCADLADWWNNINDPVLSQLIHEAVGSGSEIGGNLTLQDMAWRIQQSRAKLGITRAELFPQVQADGSYDIRKHSENVAGDAASHSVQNWDFGTSMAWELDFFGRLKRYTESAMASLAEQEELYRDAYIVLLADVANNYVDARTYQEQIEISKKNIKIRQSTLKLTQTMMEVGKSNALDVSQARGSLESVEAALPLLETAYRASINRLSVLTGNPPGHVDDVMAEVRPVPQAPEEIMVGIPAELLRRRPDIRAAEQALIAQNAMIGAAVGDLYPIFSINGSFGVNGATFGGMFDGGESITASATPGFRWNILNFGRYRNNVRLQEFLYQEGVAQYRQTVLLAAEEVDNTIASYVHERVRINKLRAAMESYDQALEVSESRFREGKADFQRVLDSQREKLTSELSYVQCKAEITTNVITLYRALGGGWLREQPQVTAANDRPAENAVSEPATIQTEDADDETI